MTDLIFDHTKEDIAEALGVNKRDVMKFFIDIDAHMSGKRSRHSKAIEFIWAADQSFEMKIASTFFLGGVVGHDVGEGESIKAIPLSQMKEIFETLKEKGLL